jgi:predicted HTH domain antitoxin
MSVKMRTFPVLFKQLEKIAHVEPEKVEQFFIMFPKYFPDLWKTIVIGAYLNDEINLSKTAELLGKHPVELRREFKKQGIPIKIGSQSLEEAEAEVNALKAL